MILFGIAPCFYRQTTTASNVNIELSINPIGTQPFNGKKVMHVRSNSEHAENGYSARGHAPYFQFCHQCYKHLGLLRRDAYKSVFNTRGRGT